MVYTHPGLYPPWLYLRLHPGYTSVYTLVIPPSLGETSSPWVGREPPPRGWEESLLPCVESLLPCVESLLPCVGQPPRVWASLPVCGPASLRV